MAGFQYNYKPLDFATASKQVAGQINPLFDRQVQGVKQQQHQNNLQAGNVAAARGLGHSGLAADQLNKIAIATQGQIGDLNAQRTSQLSQMANDLVWRDKEFNLQNRGQMFSEYTNNRDFNYGKSQDALEESWRNKQWNQMSPAEKQQMALQHSYSQKGGSGGGGGGSRGRRSRGGRRSSGGRNSSSSSSNGKNPHTQGFKLPGKTPSIAPQTYEAYAKKMAAIMEPEEYRAWLLSEEAKRRKSLGY